VNINESPISWLLSPTSILEKFAKAHNFLKTAKCLASFTFFKQNDQIPGVKKNNPFFALPTITLPTLENHLEKPRQDF